jgi:hypothetical protein
MLGSREVRSRVAGSRSESTGLRLDLPSLATYYSKSQHATDSSTSTGQDWFGC